MLEISLPLDVERDGRLVAEVLDEALAGLPDEQTDADRQQDLHACNKF
jgi:hypothetical protein